MRRIAIVVVVLVCALAVMAEDVTFMTNRRQWEQLPTATLMQMGNNYMNVKLLPDSGMLCYSIIANRYNENLKGEELEQCIRATKHTGSIYADYYSNHTEAYKQLLKAQDLAEKHHYDEFLPDIFMSIGSLYWLQEGLAHDGQHYKEALAYHKKAFWKSIDLKEYDKVSVILLNLNFVAFSKGELQQFAKERETYSRLSIPDSSDLKFMAQTMNEGVQFFSKGDPEKALEVFKYALAENEKINLLNRTSMQVMLNECIYKILLSMGRDSEALSLLNQNKETVLGKLPALIPGIYGQYAEFYRHQHNQTLADKYELLWLRTADSIAKASQAYNVNAVRFLHEIDKMNEEQRALTVKQQHDRQLLWIVGASAVVFLVMLILLAISRYNIQQNYRQLYENNLALLAAEDKQRTIATVEQPAPKYTHNPMDNDVVDELWLQIKWVMETSDEIYQDTFGIDQLATLLNAKKNYVSQTINTKTGNAFTALLNEYRIREACRRMNDREHYGNYSVEGIAQSVGYNSRSHFAKLFKAATGVPPSTYKRMARNNENPPIAEPIDTV